MLSPHENSIQYLPSEHLSTPEVQKVVVEHVSKNSDLPLHYHGNTDSDPSQVESPVPVQSLITTRGAATLSFSLQTLPCLPHMVESLFLPAATIIKHLGPNASPHQYLAILDSAYGIIDDSDNTNQDSGEKPSGYLQCLQTILSKVIQKRWFGC